MLIQGPIGIQRLNNFKYLLKEGWIYGLSLFDVTRSNIHFKLTDSAVAIRFNDQTKIVELSEPIPTENFRFPNYEQLMVLGKTNLDLAGLYNKFQLKF